MLSARGWDAKSTRRSKIRMMSSLLRAFEREDGSFDIPKLSGQLGEEICLFIPRVASLLDADIHKRKHSFRIHIRCLCMFLMTNQGQELAESSPNIIKTLVQTLGSGPQQDTTLSRDQDLITALVLLRRVACLSNHLRKCLLHHHVMSLVSSLQQRVHWSAPLQEAAGNLLLDLASVDDAAALALSCVLRKLFNSPQVQVKHAAIRMWTSVLCTNSSVVITLEGWEGEALEQLTRLLLCAPLSIQYDVAELIALLLCGRSGLGGDALLLRLTQRVGAVLCLRYTLGGNNLVQPPPDWNMKFFAGYVIEAPEILVCSLVITTLKHSEGSDAQIERPATAGPPALSTASGAEDLRGRMRASKLHFLLMAHVFWYIRDKDSMQKVMSSWSGASHENKAQSCQRLRHQLRIKMWLLRTSKDRFHTPEIKRASKVMAFSNRFIDQKNKDFKINAQINEVLPERGENDEEIELNAQETSCLSAIAVLHYWVQIDPVAAADIESAFASLSFQSQIVPIEVWPPLSKDSLIVMDVSKSMSNIFDLVRRRARQESKPQIFGKTGFRSVYLSKLLAPGKLVKDVKVSLLDALTLDGADHSALDASLDEFSASVDLSHTLSTSISKSVAAGSPVRSHSHHENQSQSQSQKNNSIFDKQESEQGVCEGFSQTRTGGGDSIFGQPISEEESADSFFFHEGKGFMSPISKAGRGSIPGKHNNHDGRTISPTSPSMRKYVDSPHRRSSVVRTPRLPRGVVLAEGRVSRWQEDAEKHERGKEHARRMTAELLLEAELERSMSPRQRRLSRLPLPVPRTQTVKATVPAPSPPKGPRTSSSRYQGRSRPTPPASSGTRTQAPPPRGIPPPSLDGELSVVSVKSFIDSFLGDSFGDSVAVDKTSKRVSKASAKATTIGNSVESLPVSQHELSLGDSIDTLSVGKSPRKPAKGGRTAAFPSATVTKIVPGEREARGSSAPSTIGHKSRPNSHNNSGGQSSCHRVINTPEAIPISLDRSLEDVSSESLCKPQTFALQMINELSELKGRGDSISAEEKLRLTSINRAITAILEHESNEVEGISGRLDTIVDGSSEDVSQGGPATEDIQWRDPLTSFNYGLSLHPPLSLSHTADEQRENVPNLPVHLPEGEKDAIDLVSYKKFAAYHNDKNREVLCDLASQDFS